MEDRLEVENNKYIIELVSTGEKLDFSPHFGQEIEETEKQLEYLEAHITESVESIKQLTPECDKTDYILSVTCGVLCGCMDIFLVGKPGESPIGNLTDKWFDNRIMDFAKLCGWKGGKDDKDKAVDSAIRFLEKKFKVPYDQTRIADVTKEVLGLTPKNHHYKSLGHNPTILGLFFSILDQFRGTATFVIDGELITIMETDSGFELRGNNILSKLFCGFINWFGHLMSDVGGSSQCKGRGMGIPSPLWSWINDIIAIKRGLGVPSSEFDKAINELAVKVFTEGFDTRFQVAQFIPVFINELLIRMVYSIRRMVRYFTVTEKENITFCALWKSCEPFSNATVKRMLTVGHGSFCFIDIGDATVRAFVAGGGTFNVTEFCLRLNVAGIGRFAISVKGEVKRKKEKKTLQKNVFYLQREKSILINYLEGLRLLASKYDEPYILIFVNEFEKCELYAEAFKKTAELAMKRGVPDDKILKTKSDIDRYFTE